MTTHDPLPVLPYAGTSGWSGSATSHERALTNDTTGETRDVQQLVLRLVAGKGPRGLTIAELRRIVPAKHHGSLSGALSNLHKADRIACLTERRERCHPYVLPIYVRGRETRAQGRR
jgi:hypothetical protein